MGECVRCAAALAVTAALAACGASHGRPPHPRRGHAAPRSRRFSGASVVHPSRPHPPLIHSGPYSPTLPASSHGPTTCTVYEPGYATQVIIDSRTLDVRADCQAWAAGQPGDGYLWGYERAAAIPDGVRLCSLSDPQRKVTATVIEEAGFVPVSAAERSHGLSACTSILASGWSEQRKPAPGTRARHGVHP